MPTLDKVNLREFRNNMAQHIGTQLPFAVTKHGQTVGYYVPVTTKPSEEDMSSLLRAAEVFDNLLTEHHINEDDIISEFQTARRNAKTISETT